jgi:hypothetical protein
MNLSMVQTIKLGILVGLSAIFMDAAIAHGLWWENDPYWTYWITKTFLITTVFTIGTAFWGIGIKQGLIISLPRLVFPRNRFGLKKETSGYPGFLYTIWLFLAVILLHYGYGLELKID